MEEHATIALAEFDAETRVRARQVHFLLLSLWDSSEAIQ
jgi:hypothetical protein